MILTNTYSRASALRASIDASLQELARLDSRPEEPTADDATIWFQKTFGGAQLNRHGGIKHYTYAAIRGANGRWYTTGQMSARVYTWDSLLDFIESDESPDALPEIWLVTEMTRLA